MRTFVLTPAASKRLIGMALASHPSVARALDRGTLVIVAGTTNAYVAEEVLRRLGQSHGFCRKGFRRGLTLPPGRDPSQVPFPGDVVIQAGTWRQGLSLFDVAESLGEGDVVLKGANALDPWGHAAVLVAHPQGGTAVAALAAAVGRRVELILPVGLEKRVWEDVFRLAALANGPFGQGPRLLPLPGTVFTELDALASLTGVRAHLMAAGGVGGAEGALWVLVTGTAEQEAEAARLVEAVQHEPPWEP